MKIRKFVEKNKDLQTRFCSFSVHDLAKEAMDVARKGPKFP
jgi:hypothetical protein